LWAWQFMFPSARCCRDPYTGRTVRFHIHERALQRAVKEAARRACIARPVGWHTFRHAFATHLLESGHNIRVVQELMGHKDVETTMIYAHVMNSSLAAVRSPADVLPAWIGLSILMDVTSVCHGANSWSSASGPDRVETREVWRSVKFSAIRPLPASLRASGRAHIVVLEMVVLQEKCTIKWYRARVATT